MTYYSFGNFKEALKKPPELTWSVELVRESGINTHKYLINPERKSGKFY